MQAQVIVNNSSIDFRNVLSNSSPDSALFLSWVDRIQKDALHTSLYSYLLSTVAPISVVSGTSTYVIPTTNGAIRRIEMVYDRTFDRLLLPVDSVSFPTNLGAQDSVRQPLQIPQEMLTAELNSEWPKYYKFTLGGVNLTLFPAPQKAAFDSTYEVYYTMQAPDVTTLSQTLLLPDDAEDLVTAGVNAYVAQFLHLDTESQYWSQQYEMYKKGVTAP